MGLFINSFMNSKSLVNGFVLNHQYFEKFAKNNNFRGTQEFSNRIICIALSSDCSLLTLNLPFKVILSRFEVVF